MGARDMGARRWVPRGALVLMSRSSVKLLLLLLLLLLATHHLLLYGARGPTVSSSEDLTWLRRSRNAQRYVRPLVDTALLGALCSGTEPHQLLLLVSSAPRGGDRRKVVRETWGDPGLRGTRLVFFMGHEGRGDVSQLVRCVPGLTQTLLSGQTDLVEEARRYQDLVVEDFLDSYGNLTLKSLFMLKWAESHCPETPYLMKTDDDMIVNVRGVLQELRAADDGEELFILGSLVPAGRPYRSGVPTAPSFCPEYLGTLRVSPPQCLLHRYPRSKWFLPDWLYAEEILPPFLSGTGYAMPRRVARELYKMALGTPLINLEDVYLTGLVGAWQVGVTLVDSPRFSSGRPLSLSPCLMYPMATAHGLEPGELKKVWEQVRSLGPDQCDSWVVRVQRWVWLGASRASYLTDVRWHKLSCQPLLLTPPQPLLTPPYPTSSPFFSHAHIFLHCSSSRLDRLKPEEMS
uniref:Hexosyltransferase n=1 Tax=Timema cristinae TaxID=61476 RepID=A0A7R9GWF8_TIMCR|nr:unnamed protein product [Timema cristinae]